jgi:hypothetical protein
MEEYVQVIKYLISIKCFYLGIIKIHVVNRLIVMIGKIVGILALLVPFWMITLKGTVEMNVVFHLLVMIGRGILLRAVGICVRDCKPTKDGKDKYLMKVRGR